MSSTYIFAFIMVGVVTLVAHLSIWRRKVAAREAQAQAQVASK